jgi:SAM-dependent methyltransferase
MQSFPDRVVDDLVGALLVAMCALGDRLGLFADLAAHGAATSAELATRTGLQERYVREWLSAMASAEYLRYDPASGRFELPAEHRPVLSQEDDELFQGGRFQYIPALFGALDRITKAFREGGGVPAGAYPADWWDGAERTNPGWIEHRLIQHWLPALPEVQVKLGRGALSADVGCSEGGALLKLAAVYPASRFVGYDQFAPAIATATSRAQAAGVAERVRFVTLDVADGLDERFDFIMTNDVIHDMADPLRGLRAIHDALQPNGVYLMREPAAAERLEENVGLAGAFRYSISLLYCLPTALAGGAAGLGAMGMPASVVRELCAQAGFGSVRRLPIEDPFDAFYALQP